MVNEFEVHVRICPILPNKTNEHNAQARNTRRLRVIEERGILCGDKKFGLFKSVQQENANQAQVYNEVVTPLVEGCFQGKNGTFIAYGQTGTGKTHTVFGSLKQQQNEGVASRALRDIFAISNQKINESKIRGNLAVRIIKLSAMEIYNDEFRDMLSPTSVSPLKSNNLNNLHEIIVQKLQSGIEIFKNISSTRIIAESKRNEESSRSHCFISISIEMVEYKYDGANNKYDTTSVSKQLTQFSSKLMFVDLAGSERVKNNTGLQIHEAVKINKGLLALSQVIRSLSRPNVKHVPYRESKLTYALKDSFGVNCRATFLTCISADSNNLAESSFTLAYATMVKRMRNKRMNINHHQKVENNETAKIIVSSLKEQLQEMQKEHYKNSILNPLLEQYKNPNPLLSKESCTVDEAILSSFSISKASIGSISTYGLVPSAVLTDKLCVESIIESREDYNSVKLHCDEIEQDSMTVFAEIYDKVDQDETVWNKDDSRPSKLKNGILKVCTTPKEDTNISTTEGKEEISQRWETDVVKQPDGINFIVEEKQKEREKEKEEEEETEEHVVDEVMQPFESGLNIITEVIQSFESGLTMETKKKEEEEEEEEKREGEEEEKKKPVVNVIIQPLSPQTKTSSLVIKHDRNKLKTEQKSEFIVGNKNDAPLLNKQLSALEIWQAREREVQLRSNTASPLSSPRKGLLKKLEKLGKPIAHKAEGDHRIEDDHLQCVENIGEVNSNKTKIELCSHLFTGENTIREAEDGMTVMTSLSNLSMPDSNFMINDKENLSDTLNVVQITERKLQEMMHIELGKILQTQQTAISEAIVESLTPINDFATIMTSRVINAKEYSGKDVVESNPPPIQVPIVAVPQAIENIKTKKAQIRNPNNTESIVLSTFSTAKGDRYIGNLYDGKMHGQGVLYYTNGSVYTGEFKYNLRDGQGFLKFPNGETFEGSFKRDMRNGHGTMIYKTEGKYCGDYLNNRRHGLGKMICPDGSIYEGDFVNHRYHGKGTYFFCNGDKYEGDWVRGKMNGHGTMVYKNKDVYIGKFIDNARHGTGSFKIAESGKICRAEFAFDQIQAVNDEVQGIHRQMHAYDARCYWTGNRG